MHVKSYGDSYSAKNSELGSNLYYMEMINCVRCRFSSLKKLQDRSHLFHF